MFSPVFPSFITLLIFIHGMILGSHRYEHIACCDSPVVRSSVLCMDNSLALGPKIPMVPSSNWKGCVHCYYQTSACQFVLLLSLLTIIISQVVACMCLCVFSDAAQMHKRMRTTQQHCASLSNPHGYSSFSSDLPRTGKILHVLFCFILILLDILKDLLKDPTDLSNLRKKATFNFWLRHFPLFLNLIIPQSS